MRKTSGSSEKPAAVQLRVIEAKHRDVGKRRARIDPQLMSRLGIQPGEIIELAGKRSTAVTSWPADEEEKEHEEWLEEQIRALGGDAHSPSEHSILVQAESEGIERVMRRDDSIAHDFHALLTAELADNAGWDLLLQLADEFGDRKAKKEFKKRLHAEEKHLLFVRETLLRLTAKDVGRKLETLPLT